MRLLEIGVGQGKSVDNLDSIFQNCLKESLQRARRNAWLVSSGNERAGAG